MVDFEITIARPSDPPGVAIVTVAGEVDVSTASQVENAIVSVIDGDLQTCIVDLTGVWFLDSSGISALINARHELDTRGVALRTLTSKDVHRVLEVGGLLEHFAVTHDSDQALDLARQLSPNEQQQGATS